MIITICILIFTYTLIGKPIGKLTAKLKDVDWRGIANNIGESVKTFCLKTGKNISYPLLTFLYVMTDEDTSVTDKALVYGALLYIISPFDFIPRRIFHILGVLDDAAVATFILKKIYSSVTPKIRTKVEAIMIEWFGTSIVGTSI